MTTWLAVMMAGVMVLCGTIAWGNDGVWTGIGGAVKLMKGHPSVVMQSARIKIHLASERVECEYVFKNTGAATKVLMGFPESGWGGVSVPEGAETHFREFRSWVDGKKVRVTPRPATGDGSHYERVWVKDVAFSAKQTRVVRNTYFGGSGIDVSRISSFHYELSPAASWKGKVGTIEVEVDLTPMGGFFTITRLLGVEPSGHKRSGNVIRWRWRNIEPKHQMDIGISYHAGYDDIWIDGRKWQPWHPRPEPWLSNPYPYVNNGVLTAKCTDIAQWLGLEFSEDGTLAGQGKRLDVKQIAEGGLGDLGEESFAPLKPVADAFGARVRFDPVTKRTYVHTAKALAAAKTPEWLDRQLTEADLKGKSAADLRMMTNEIYARRGREFQNREVRRQFYCRPWYAPNPKYTDALLTAVDRANIALLQRAEQRAKLRRMRSSAASAGGR